MSQQISKAVLVVVTMKPTQYTANCDGQHTITVNSNNSPVSRLSILTANRPWSGL
jgi:hypothetical protein